MTTREYLSQIRRYDKMISNKLEEISNLRYMAYGTSAPANEERVQSSGSNDKLGTFVCKIIDTERYVDKIVSKRWEIVHEIENMDNTDEYNILAKKYILQKTIKEIAIEEHETERHVLRLVSKSMNSFENKYGKKYL